MICEFVLQLRPINSHPPSFSWGQLICDKMKYINATKFNGPTFSRITFVIRFDG